MEEPVDDDNLGDMEDKTILMSQKMTLIMIVWVSSVIRKNQRMR